MLSLMPSERRQVALAQVSVQPLQLLSILQQELLGYKERAILIFGVQADQRKASHFPGLIVGTGGKCHRTVIACPEPTR